MAEEFREIHKRCKYEIICPNRPTSLDCDPLICDTFSSAEREISEKELSQAIIYELYREDLRDY